MRATTRATSPFEPASASGRNRRRTPARRGQGQGLRQDIVEAASAMIARTGDASLVTLRALAREVGVAATSIYLHFASVEDVVAEVKRVRFDELGATLRAAADSAGSDPVARIRSRGLAYLRYGQEHPGEYSVMFSARLAVPGAVRTPVRMDALEDLVADVMAALDAAGRPEPVEGARMIAVHLWTSLHGTAGLHALGRLGLPDIEEQVADLVARLLDR